MYENKTEEHGCFATSCTYDMNANIRVTLDTTGARPSITCSPSVTTPTILDSLTEETCSPVVMFEGLLTSILPVSLLTTLRFSITVVVLAVVMVIVTLSGQTGSEQHASTFCNLHSEGIDM